MVNDATRDTHTCAGKACLICQLFAKYRSADPSVSLRNLSY